MSGMQVNLPDLVTLQLSGSDVAVILNALQGHGPFKTVFPVLGTIEQQLMSQQLPPPAEPQAAEPIAHHPV
jgi:hypothetical protein